MCKAILNHATLSLIFLGNQSGKKRTLSTAWKYGDNLNIMTKYSRTCLFEHPRGTKMVLINGVSSKVIVHNWNQILFELTGGGWVNHIAVTVVGFYYAIQNGAY